MAFGMIRVSINNVERLQERGKKATAAIIATQRKIILKGAFSIRNDAVLAVQRGPKTGRQYGNHTASAPGEAPATNTGALVRGISVRVEIDGNQVDIVSKEPYSLTLEFGSEDGRIAARPFMFPAYNKHLPQIRMDLRNARRLK